MPTRSASISRPPVATPAPRQDRSDTDRAHSVDTRMLARQQVRLLSGLTRLLSRLLRSLLWQELSSAERRRVLLLLARLEHDLALLRHVTGTPPLGTEPDSGQEMA